MLLQFFLRSLAGLLFSLTAAGPVWAAPWLLVNTETSTIQVMQGDRQLAVFEDISVGRGGTTDLHVLGDDATPKGEYRIIKINSESRYRLFFQIDYPTIPHAQKALGKGIIDQATYEKIVDQRHRNGNPPQDTPLGGFLGIHGIGGGDPLFHKTFNWTNGCVAVTNAQIEALARWIGVGTRVVIE